MRPPLSAEDHHGFIPSTEEDLLRRRVKAELRKRMRALRKAVPLAACNARSEKIAVRLVELPVLAGARAVALFSPMRERHEVDLTSLDRALRRRGARIAYPRIVGASLEFSFVDDAAAMEPHTLGHLEPGAGHPRATPGDLEAVVVPALAVDSRGHRIGYGGGFYDRAIRELGPVVSVAVAFDFQLVAEVPDTAGDVPVNWIVTDGRTLLAGP